MNEQSLERVNAFLAAAAARTEVGAVLDVTPAEIGRELGFPDALSTARAVRALIARKRLEAAMGSYRLLDPRPVEADEKEAVGRRPRKTGRARAAAGGGRRSADSAAYSDFGQATVDRMVELGREAAELRAALRTAREEARGSRQARDEAEARARTLTDKVRDLEARAEMAESNLRTLLATVRSKETARDAPVSDSEMEAILGVLKGGEEAVVDGSEP
jgi:DNA-directed RNA polymerase sigma subunit (sigma70/sigma32)